MFMASAVEKFINSLKDNNVEEEIVSKILEGYEKISDTSKKPQKAKFFMEAMKRMDELLDYETRYKIRDVCACCKGGWREKSAKKVAIEYENKSIEEKLDALRQIEHMGNPVYNGDNTIIAGIGGENGCNCACSIFSGAGGKQPEESVSPTYCLCCAGHFRYLYQIALGKKIKTKEVLSAALDSLSKKPCRFLYQIED